MGRIFHENDPYGRGQFDNVERYARSPEELTTQLLTTPEAFQPDPLRRFQAGFLRQNVITAVPDLITLMSADDKDTGFDSMSPENLKGYEEFASSFITVVNEEQNAIVKDMIDRQKELLKLTADGETSSVLGELFGAILSPASAVPILGQTRAASILGRAGQAASRTAGVIGAEELVLQATQPTRSAEETFFGITAGAVFSGLLGTFMRPGVHTSKRGGGFPGRTEDVVDDLERTFETPPTDRPTETANAKFNDYFGEVAEAEKSAARHADAPPDATPSRVLEPQERTALDEIVDFLDEEVPQITDQASAVQAVEQGASQIQLREIRDLLDSGDRIKELEAVRRLEELFQDQDFHRGLPFDRFGNLSGPVEAIELLRKTFKADELPFGFKSRLKRDADQRRLLGLPELSSAEFSATHPSPLIDMFSVVRDYVRAGGAIADELLRVIGSPLRRDLTTIKATLDEVSLDVDALRIRASILSGRSDPLSREILRAHAQLGSEAFTRARDRFSQAMEAFEAQPRDPIALMGILKVLREEQESLRLIPFDETGAKNKVIARRIDSALGRLSELETKIASAPDFAEKVRPRDGRLDQERPRDPDARTPRKGVSAEGVGEEPSINEQLDDVTLLPAGGLEKLPTGPLKEMLMSSELAVRELALRLVENPFFLKGHRHGHTFGAPVESRIRRHWWPTAETIVEINRQYDIYRGGAGDTRLRANARRAIDDALRGRGDALSPTEFRNEIGKAMHMGDEHHIPEVQAAAQFARKKVFDPFLEQLMEEEVFVSSMKRSIRKLEEELKITNHRVEQARIRNMIAKIGREIEEFQKLGPQHTNADSFAPIIYRMDRIQENYDAFKQVLRDHFAEGGLKGDALEAAVAETAKKIERSRPYIKIDEEAVGTARSLKERTLDIPVEKMFEFIELDIEGLLRHYTRTMAADLELTRGFGDHTLAAQIDEIHANFQARIDAPGQSPSERTKLWKERDRMIQVIRAVRDRIRGTYGLPDDPYRGVSQFIRGAKQFQYLTYLGGVTISSLPDMARLIMTEGMERSMRDAFVPLARNLEGLKLTTKEARIAGTALEMEMGFRAQAFTELGDVFGRHNPIERALTTGSSAFSIINLFNQWNSSMKSLASSVIGARVIEDSIVTSTPFRNSLETKVIKMKPGTITTGKDKRVISARYNRRANTIELDEAEVKATYEVGAWHSPKVEGVDPLEPDFINSLDEWREFIMEHELAHADYKKKPKGESRGQYENRINRIAQNRIMVKRLNRATDMSKFGREKLARAGIDDEMADRIAQQWEQHGRFHEDLMIPNTEAWDDVAAQDAFRAALGSDVDRAIVTPGAGDRFLWMSTELGSVIGQFKSFSVASAQRVLIPGIQQRDGHVLMGLAAMVAIGMIVDEIKRQQYGIKTGGSLTERITNGIDRSGITGYFGDINRMVERISDNRLGLNAALGTAPPFKPSFRSKAGAVLGPTADQMIRISEILSDTLSGEYDYRTAGALRRTIPGHNVLWLKPAYDLMEEGASF